MKIKNFFLKRKFNIIISLSAILAMWLIWIAAYYSVKNDYLIPSIQDTFKSLFACFKSWDFWVAFFGSLFRTFLAFIISFILAGTLVSLAVVCKGFGLFIKPFIEIFRTLPTLAIILILLFWTTPAVAPTVVTILVIFPVIFAQLNAAIGGIDHGIIEMAEVYKISVKEKLFRIYLPMIAPNTLSQTGANISLGIKVMISAEVLAGTYKSLGGLMQNARFYIDMPRLAALTIIAVLLGFLIDFCFSLIERVTFKWSKK